MNTIVRSPVQILISAWNLTTSTPVMSYRTDFSSTSPLSNQVQVDSLDGNHAILGLGKGLLWGFQMNTRIF